MTLPNRPARQKLKSEPGPDAPAASRGWKLAAWGLSLLTVVILAGLSILAQRTPYFPFELSFTEAVQKLASPALDSLALSIDWLGYVPQMPIITAVLGIGLFALGWRWEGVLTVAALVVEASIDGVIKVLVRRPRPDAPGIHIYHPHGDFTYPSGHVFSFVMVFGLLAYFCAIWLRSPVVRAGLLTLLVGLCVVIGPVRIYLGEHWAIDVLAGYLLGGLGLFWMIRLYGWGRQRRLRGYNTDRGSPIDYK